MKVRVNEARAEARMFLETPQKLAFYVAQSLLTYASFGVMIEDVEDALGVGSEENILVKLTPFATEHGWTAKERVDDRIYFTDVLN
ncbi:MAG: hypothetical protein ABIY70_04800 [Capsulimonas sp.]|uniref:hypothetical protein n=1 Tax=Capsulimonas sp. TaxID=2494211 RepID=UPI0032650B43